MIGVDIINILARHDIDLVVPLSIQGAKLFNLFFLLLRKVRKIMKYE